jgi:hypothetical protein
MPQESFDEDGDVDLLIVGEFIQKEIVFFLM